MFSVDANPEHGFFLQKQLNNMLKNKRNIEKQKKKAVFDDLFSVFEGLYDLENVESQVIRLGDIPKNGVIGGLLSCLNLSQRYPCILGGVVEHLLEIGVCHEVGARAGCQIATAG